MTTPRSAVSAPVADYWSWPAPPGTVALEEGTIHTFAFTVDLPAAERADLELLLSQPEIARADRFHFARDRGRYITARGRLRQLVGHHADRAPATLEFEEGPFGKPALSLGQGNDRLRFNLSRSDGVGVVALGLDGELGVDVEQLRPFADALSIAERMFSGDERRVLRALPDGKRAPAFFDYWIRKEAVVKSTGRGLSTPLAGFTLSPEQGDDAERVSLECEGRVVARWVRRLPAPRAGFVAAVAADGSPGSVCCWTWPSCQIAS
ncbi:MAG: 4'-phosphopantetheinyl transferase superfamily protein [Gemmatimonadales bacterium]